MNNQFIRNTLRALLVGVLLVVMSGCVVRARVRPGAAVVGPPQPVSVRTAPPPPPANAVVVAPTSRPGHVFVRGHYRWNNGRWVWARHRWVPARSGHRWVQPHYNRQRGVFVRGHWVSGGARVRVSTPPARRRTRRNRRRNRRRVVQPAPAPRPARRPAPPPPPSPPR